jgi:hypothetical protein
VSVARRRGHIEDSGNKFELRVIRRFGKGPKFFQCVGLNERRGVHPNHNSFSSEDSVGSITWS